jgi:hypothetical protein
MTRRVHFECEVLFGTVVQPLCENQTGRDAILDAAKPALMTDDEAEVTCRRCLKALGYEPVPVNQLTECQPDPLRRAA